MTTILVVGATVLLVTWAAAFIIGPVLDRFELTTLVAVLMAAGVLAIIVVLLIALWWGLLSGWTYS